MGRLVLTEADVAEIRSLFRSGALTKEIASRFSVHEFTVRRILRGKLWAHVPDPLGPIALRERKPAPIESGNARLNWTLVDEIRGHLNAGMTIREVAKRYGVCRGTIAEISCGKTWKAEDRFRGTGDG